MSERRIAARGAGEEPIMLKQEFIKLEGNSLIDLRHGFKFWMSMDEFLFFNVHNLKISSDPIIIKSSGKSLIPQIVYTYLNFGKSLIPRLLNT